MAYLLVEDSKGGVDRRRPIYAAPPGTLWECINAHITRGGDTEIRKAFVNMGDFSPATFGLHPKADILYTFGSEAALPVPGFVTYMRLQYAGGVMTDFVGADNFNGKIYAICAFSDGAVVHFYDGVIVSAWNDGVVRPAMSNLNGIATSLAALIDASATYTASSVGPVITMTAATPGTPFTVLTEAQNGGAVDDQTLTAVTTVANTATVAAVAATATFSCQGGSGAGAASSVRVGGIETMAGGPIAWGTSNTVFAAAIAASLTASGLYTATSANQDVTIHAVTAGTAPNGLSVEVTTTGTGRLGNQSAAGTNTITTMSGGVAAVAAVAQVVTLTVGGTFEPGDRFGVRAQSGVSLLTTEYFGNYAQPTGNAVCLKTHKTKMYVGAGPLIEFSRVNDATLWNVDVDPGAGFVNASTHNGGSELVLALTAYQGRLAAFSRHAIQLWLMQADDDLNDLQQIIENTGTNAPRSAREFGGNDVFYLDDSGIRSLKARDASNNAFLSDVGVAIDKVVSDWIKHGTPIPDPTTSVSIIDPVDGRFWIAIGERIFVYSFFPNVNIAAWSWYEPGFAPESFAITENRLWVRAADTLYLYGGESGEEYGTDYDATIQHPFLTVKKAGTFKQFGGMDIAATGAWECQWLMSPNDLGQHVDLGTNEGVTFPEANWGGVGHATHVAPKLVHHAAGAAASVSQLALYYQGAEEST